MRKLISALAGIFALFCAGQAYAGATIIAPQLPRVIDIRTFGAKCDGVTNDVGAINAASVYLRGSGGGIVYLPPTGRLCAATGFSLPSGVSLEGMLGSSFPGPTATPAQYAAAGGSWLLPLDPTNPAITMGNHGNDVSQIGIAYPQNIPTTSFTPIFYPYAVKMACDTCTLSDVTIVGASHGIQLVYPQASGGGTNVNIRNVLDEALVTCFSENYVNDVVHIDNLHCRNLYYASNAAMQAWLLANLVGMDDHYFDNPTITNYDCLYCAVGMRFTDDTVMGNTHSLYNGQLANIQCDLVVECMASAASTTTVTGAIAGLQMQSAGGATATLLNLPSDNVRLTISNLAVPFGGSTLANVGGGHSGSLGITGANIAGYSQTARGQTGFVVNKGAVVSMSGAQTFGKPSGAGIRFAGAGAANGVWTDRFRAISVFTVPGQLTGATNGSNQTLTVPYLQRPGQEGVFQMRITGSFTITTPVANSTLGLSLALLPEIAATGISGATSGSVSFDSGWIDVTPAHLTALTNLGAVIINGSPGIRWSSNALQIMTR